MTVKTGVSIDKDYTVHKGETFYQKKTDGEGFVANNTKTRHGNRVVDEGRGLSNRLSDNI